MHKNKMLRRNDKVFYLLVLDQCYANQRTFMFEVNSASQMIRFGYAVIVVGFIRAIISIAGCLTEQQEDE